MVLFTFYSVKKSVLQLNVFHRTYRSQKLPICIIVILCFRYVFTRNTFKRLIEVQNVLMANYLTILSENMILSH